MAAIDRRTLVGLRSTEFTLATADDLDGTTDGTQQPDVSGATRVLYLQVNDGTAGTAGIDAIEVSKDGGTTWAADTTLLLLSANDATGTVDADGLLNAAGVEPTLFAAWTGGPYEGSKVYVRCGRKTTTTAGTTWVTGAPTVKCVLFGGKHSGGAPTARA